jgi:hypothetical protein
MFDLTPQDDFVHSVGSEESWRESYSFDFLDASARLSGFGLLGVNPNQRTGDCVFALWRDDILLVKSAKWDYHLPREIGEERQHFGPLALRPVAPFKSWEISYDDGYCRLELAFDSIHAPYCWAQPSGNDAQAASRHYQQQGRYRGVVRVGKDSIPVQGLGGRDHGWGPDARLGLRRWFSASAQFSEKLAFQTLQMTLADGRELLFGYVFHGAHNDAVLRSRVSASYDMRHAAPSGCTLELGTVGGERLSAVVRALNAFNTSFQERSQPGFRFSCAAEFQMDNQTGHGRLNTYWTGTRERPEQWVIEPAGVVPQRLGKLRGDFDDTVF